MKSKSFLNLLIIWMIISIIGIIFTNSSKIKKKMNSRNRMHLRKQFGESYKSNLISQIGRTDSVKKITNRDAVTYGIGGEQSIKIPDDHPIMTNMKRAKYVDRLRYFEDAPTLGSSEANTIDKLDEAYYSPFETRNFNPIPVSTITCEHFRNPYDCQSGGPCGWDGRLMSCFIVHGPVNLKTFSFKEKMSNRKKKIIFFKK